MEPQQTPSELREWTLTRLSRIEQARRKAEGIDELHVDDQAAWCQHMIESVRRLRDECRQIELLLTVYTYDQELLPLPTIAKAAGLTPNGVRHRASSPTAADLWEEALSDHPRTGQ